MLATHSTPQLWATTVPSSFPVKMDEEQNDSKGRHRAVDSASLIRSKKNWTGTSSFGNAPGPFSSIWCVLRRLSAPPRQVEPRGGKLDGLQPEPKCSRVPP